MHAYITSSHADRDHQWRSQGGNPFNTGLNVSAKADSNKKKVSVVDEDESVDWEIPDFGSVERIAFGKEANP